MVGTYRTILIFIGPEYLPQQANSQTAMNFFGQKEEKPVGPDPLFAGACCFVEVVAAATCCVSPSC
jgi:hypothetical protein